MVYCSVVGCTNSTIKGKRFQGSMHSFPPDEKLKNAWISKINRKNYTWNKHHRICSDHFLDSDFIISRTTALEIGFSPGLFQLHKWAIPSLKLKGSSAVEVVTKRKSLAVTKRRNLETIQSFETRYDTMDCALNTSEVAVDCESEPVPATHVNVGTQAFVQTCEKQVLCKPLCQSKRVQCKRIHSMPRGTQTTNRMVADKRVGCDIPRCKVYEEEIESDQDSGSNTYNEREDPAYDPEEDMRRSSSDDEDTHDIDKELTDHLHDSDDRKFIVYASCLRILLAICSLCSAPCRVFIKIRKGTAIVLQAICTRNHSRLWSSQPSHMGLAEGNLCIASSLFYAGSSIVKTINMMKFAKIQTFSIRTYELIQRSYLIPAINNVWERQQFLLFSRIQEEGGKVSVGGDARCDSPGHCAKYGSYTFLDVNRGLILCTNLVQCNEVGSSVATEKEGLIRCLDELESNSISVSTLITDRHPSVRKYIRESEPDIKHYFDVWHIAKGIKKKLHAQGQKKGFERLSEWQPSVVNHLHWVAATSEGNGEMVKAKWLSLLNHVCDVHEGHGEIFPECQHEDLGERSWFKKGSREYKAFANIIQNGYILKDVPNMSPKDQTSALEGFHKLVCFFAPKLLHFPYNSMKARCLLAALHFNENASRKQKRSRNGSLQWRATYPKYRKGDGVVRPVKGPCTFEYVEELMAEATSLRHLYPSYRVARVNKDFSPATITETSNVVPKDELVKRHLSRFTST